MLKIAQMRKDKKWSQAELAARAGVRPATISDVERLGTASLATLMGVAAAFNVHVIDLFDDDRDDPDTRDLIDQVRRLGPQERAAFAAILGSRKN